jgi:hypothetical protein
VSEPALPEGLVRFVQVLVEDEELRAWFESFDGVDQTRRAAEFHGLAARMKAADEHPDLIQATALLANPAVFAGAQAALREALEEP